MSIWPLTEDGQSPSEARQAAREHFLSFNISDAQAFEPSERDHLLEKIESGFGDYSRFNEICAHALVSRLARS